MRRMGGCEGREGWEDAKDAKDGRMGGWEDAKDAKGAIRMNDLTDFHGTRIGRVIDRRLWDIPVVGIDDDLDHVLRILMGKYHVWVVENTETMRLRGVVTEHDVFKMIAPERRHFHILGLGDIKEMLRHQKDSIEHVMCSLPVTCGPDDTVRDALVMMKKHSIRRLPVVENDRLVGEITFHALLNRYLDTVHS